MKKRNTKNKITKVQRILYSRLFLCISFVVILGVGSGVYDNYQQSKDVFAEIEGLEQKVHELQKKNNNVTDVIRYLESADYVEAQAKEKLGLARADERSVIIPDEVVQRLKDHQQNGFKFDDTQERDLIANISRDDKSNYQLWRDYFF